MFGEKAKKPEGAVKEEPKAEDNKKETEKEDNYEQQLSFLKAELAKSKEESESWKNKFYQAYADLANTRKSLEKDHESMIRYRSQGFVEKMLPALDSFQMAFMVEPTDEKIKNYCTGFKMILGQLEQALTDEGIKMISPKKGDKFDPSTMHAIQTVDGEEDNLVNSVYVKGYMLYDRLIRPAMVIVTKKKVEEKKTEEAKPAEEKKDETTEDAKKEKEAENK